MSVLCNLFTAIEDALSKGKFNIDEPCPPQIIPRLQRILEAVMADNAAKSILSASAPVPVSAPAPAPASAPTPLKMLSSPFENTAPDVIAAGQSAFSVIASSKSNPEP